MKLRRRRWWKASIIVLFFSSVVWLIFFFYRPLILVYPCQTTPRKFWINNYSGEFCAYLREIYDEQFDFVVSSRGFGPSLDQIPARERHKFFLNTHGLPGSSSRPGAKADLNDYSFGYYDKPTVFAFVRKKDKDEIVDILWVTIELKWRMFYWFCIIDEN